MLRALLIDDERLALLQLDKMLKELTSLTVTAAYTDPAEALQAARLSQPDIVFLDIHMPEINGMQVADELLQTCPSAKIIFMTAYDVYAIEAFEFNQLDYVLKPLQRSRLIQTVQRVEERNNRASCELAPLPDIPWRTTQAQELFAYLLHHRNCLVSKERLADTFWPQCEPKKAAAQLFGAMAQIRQCLRQAGAALKIRYVHDSEAYELHSLDGNLDVE
ncbi:response regulator [Paenibacillus oryzisoli]|uniref:response regulator n=1 Tax=Paenibacillus oryzisoli TaxID=1850517 RepID=UPI003D2929CE